MRPNRGEVISDQLMAKLLCLDRRLISGSSNKVVVVYLLLLGIKVLSSVGGGKWGKGRVAY